MFNQHVGFFPNVFILWVFCCVPIVKRGFYLCFLCFMLLFRGILLHFERVMRVVLLDFRALGFVV